MLWWKLKGRYIDQLAKWDGNIRPLEYEIYMHQAEDACLDMVELCASQASFEG